jgi:thiosulfate/3-mercaptopyruvate sulfurtransferase
MGTQGTNHAGPVVDVAWVAEHLDDPAVRLVEVDEHQHPWRVDHLPGAVAWRWREDLRDPARRDIVSQEGLRELLGRSGVGPATTVVFYGGQVNWFAAYAYWVCRLRGFDRVLLMDGGRVHWAHTGGRFSDRLATPTADDPGPLGLPRPKLRALRDDVIAGLGDPLRVLLDVRMPTEFNGEMLAPPHLPHESGLLPGHIPGAVNMPWVHAVGEDGTFRPAEAVRPELTALGVTPDKEVVVYSRIGERSAYTWFVLHELLGYPRVRNYDGSWSEYGSLVGVPVER